MPPSRIYGYILNFLSGVMLIGIPADLFTNYRVGFYYSPLFHVLSAGNIFTVLVFLQATRFILHRRPREQAPETRPEKTPRIFPVLYRLASFSLTRRDEEWLDRNHKKVIALFCVALTISIFAVLGVKHVRYGHLPDYDIFMESFHSADRGENFLNHFHFWMVTPPEKVAENPTGRKPIFGDHYRPSFYLFLAVFKLFPSPYILLALQALIVGLSPWPCFLLARLYLKRTDHALPATLCVCFNPALLGASWTFFPAYISIPFVVFAFYFIDRKNPLAALPFILALLSFKETLAVPGMLIGVYCIFKGSRKTGLAVFLGSGFYLVACLKWIIPHYAGAAYAYTSFYADYGDSIPQAMVNLLLHPHWIIQRVLEPEVLVYLAGIILPFGGVQLFSRKYLLILPLLAQNVFATRAIAALFYAGHLAAPLVPFSYLAFLSALENRDAPERRLKTRPLLAYAFIFALALIPLADHKPYTDRSLRTIGGQLERLTREGDTLAFSNVGTLWAHFAGRNRLERYPDAADKADWAVVIYDQKECGKQPIDDGRPLVPGPMLDAGAYMCAQEARGQYAKVLEIPYTPNDLYPYPKELSIYIGIFKRNDKRSPDAARP